MGSFTAHTRTDRESEKESDLQFLMAASLCRKFPLISSSPRPHILPALFPCFPSHPGDSGETGGQWKPSGVRRCLSAGPPPRAPTIGTVRGKRGRRIRNSTGRGSREAKVRFGKRSVIGFRLESDWMQRSVAHRDSRENKINGVACN